MIDKEKIDRINYLTSNVKKMTDDLEWYKLKGMIDVRNSILKEIPKITIEIEELKLSLNKI